MNKARLGQILLDFQLVSESQLSECLDAQERDPGRRPLGEILVDQGVIDESTLDSILSVQHRKVSIDRAQGQLSRDDLEERLQNASIRGYLETVVELGAVRAAALVGRSPDRPPPRPPHGIAGRSADPIAGPGADLPAAEPEGDHRLLRREGTDPQPQRPGRRSISHHDLPPPPRDRGELPHHLQRAPSARRPRCAAHRRALRRVQPRPGVDHRTVRKRQDDDARLDHRSHQPDDEPSHHHHRGAGRGAARERPLARLADRGRPARHLLLGRAQGLAAPRTPTSSSSATCALPRWRTPRSPRPRPVTSSSRPCRRATRSAPSTGCSTSSRPPSASRSASCSRRRFAPSSASSSCRTTTAPAGAWRARSSSPTPPSPT